MENQNENQGQEQEQETLSDIAKHGRFQASELKSVVERLQAASDFDEDKLKFNIDFETGVKENHDLIVKTRKQRGEDEVDIVALLEIPTVEALNAVSDTYVKDIIRNQLASKAMSLISRSEGDEIPFPRSVLEWTTKARGGIDKEVFNEYWSELASALREFTKYSLKKKELEMAFSNNAWLAHYYPRLATSGVIVKLLQAAITQAENDGQDTALFTTWLNTRNSRTFSDDVDFDSIDFSFGEDEQE